MMIHLAMVSLTYATVFDEPLRAVVSWLKSINVLFTKSARLCIPSVFLFWEFI